ncbi:MAG: hypothetical protein GXO43_08830, partial [Crenarchaeota archaeon]|nr:hypothetical protein [Thermoproteota archaeon]
ALAIIDMPVFGKDWPKPIRLIQEKMDWVFLASPAIYYCLNKTLPPRIDLKTMYTNVLPRLIKAIVLPGVMYYPITKNYETPITLRLTERGVCKDYAYASAFLADSLGLVAVDMFGVDPRTGINHSLSGLIIPSSLRIKKGIQVIKDIDGDGEKEYLVPLVDTAKIPLKLLTKGGFTDNLIVDPGIPILGMDPYREKIDYYWYIQYFIGLDKDYKSLPPPFRPKWTAITDKLMLTLAHLYDNITLNYTRLTIKLVVDGDITSKTFSWLAILEKKNNLSMSEIFKLIQSNAVLDISSYKPHEWITVFAEFIASKIILNIVTPPLVLSYDTKVGQTHGIPDWFWKLVYKYWTIGSAETVTPTITQTKKYLQITVSPVFHKEGNKYVFVCLQGSEIINGTKYSVVVRPTNKIGIIQITVTVDDHTYIFTVQNTPSDWPILTIKKAFDGYSGLMICANYTLSDVLSIRLNYTDNRLVVSSNYTVGILGIHYYISIINKTFYMKLYIYSGFPQIMFARITIHYKRGPVIEEVLSPSIYINGSTGGIIDTVEHVLLLKDIKDIDSIIVFVRAIDATLVIYFYPSSSS